MSNMYEEARGESEAGIELMMDIEAKRKAANGLCPYCGIKKRGHPLRCHIQACSARNKPITRKSRSELINDKWAF